MKSLALVLSITIASLLLLGAPVYSADDDPLFLGQANRDWVYTAVDPCRIVDTRVAPKWGMSPIAGGTSRIIKVRGAVADQNGGNLEDNPLTCPSPKGEPRAVHMTVTAADHSSVGHLQVYPATTGLPGSSFLNFQASQNIANSGTIRNNYRPNPANENDIQIYASSTTHVVVDVLGYYYDEPVLIDDDFAQGTGVEPFGDSNWRFVAPVASVEVTGQGQKIVVVSHQSFECESGGADCDNLDIAICTQVGAAFTIEGPPVQDVFTDRDNRKLLGLSAILTKPPGIYDVGLCAKTEDVAWDDPSGGQTSAFVLSY